MLTSLALGLLLTAAPTPAPTPLFVPGDAEATRFREAYEKGEALYRAQEFGGAIANFRAADRVRPTPEVAYDLAKCHEKLGDGAFAAYYYRLYLRRAPQASDGPEVSALVGKALARAEVEGKGLLELEAPRAGAVTVAGRSYPETPVAIYLPGGEYEVAADFPAGKKAMRVRVAAGKASSVTFEPLSPPVVSAPGPTPAAVTAAKTTVEAPVAPPPTNALRVVSYVIGAVGLAAVGTGAAFGVLSKQDAARSTNHALTLAQAQDAARSANSKAVTANVLFGVGGGAVGVGVLMFAFSFPDAPAAHSSATSK